MTHTTKTLRTDALCLQSDLQMRAVMDGDTLDEYAAAMKAGHEFPPIRVVATATDFLVCDGFHRVNAARRAGIAELPCIVTQGTHDDALLIALHANATNGLRRSNADKRRAVAAALARWPEKSDRVIAELCGVAHPLVASCRPQDQLEESSSSFKSARERDAHYSMQDRLHEARVGADGKTRRLPAAKPAAPPPEPEPEYVDCGPDESELAASLAAEESDRRTLDLLLAADDKLAAAVAEIKRLNAELAVVKGQRNRFQNQAAEFAQQIKRLKRQARIAA